MAITAAKVRDSLGADPAAAVQAARRPFDRLVGPPVGSHIVLHGTSAAEVSAELCASSVFVQALLDCVGCPEVVAELTSEASIESLAGGFVLNAIGIKVPGAGPCGSELRGAGVFVLLSTMNHSCSPSVEATFDDGCSTVTLRTIRAVAAHEPLTLAYVPTDWSVNARRDRLRHWFFNCDCWRCEAESKVEEALGR